MIFAGAVSAPSEADAFFAEFAAKRAGIVVLQADYLQQDISPDETLLSLGALIYAKPRRILFRKKDSGDTILVDGRVLYSYEPGLKQLEINDLGDARNTDIFFFGFDGDTELLRESYDVALFERDGDPRGKRGLRIRPKGLSPGEAPFQEINIYLRDDDYLPYLIHITHDAYTQTSIEMSNYAINKQPKSGQTQIEVAEGTKIIENNRVIAASAPAGMRLPEAILVQLPQAEKPGAAGASQRPRP